MEYGIRFKIPTVFKLPRSITRESVKDFAEILEGKVRIRISDLMQR